MVLIRFVSVLAAASMLLTAAADDTPTTTPIKNPIATPTTTLAASEMTSIGCFATATPLENHGEWKFQSPGNCQLICLQEGKNVMAVSDGLNCYCGDKIPAKEWQIGDDQCDTPCAGDKSTKCGGPGHMWVVLTGNTLNRVEYFDPASSSSTAKPSSANTPSAASAQTPTDGPSSAPNQKASKPNTAGIAAGVVVGIVGLAAILAGVWFFLRHRRQKQAEDDFRRNAHNIDSFVAGGDRAMAALRITRTTRGGY
ncbi:hypothetical protein BDU57DRAFT_21289 [Ampelomyces quisqualis]|uniref:WSC domain-containing protein n=1 Tax=Ampelomyces quisqualis TaxID=50730 RepID=A0A6A5R0M6_AMPQU|nr:hypothetical protein BDU57DRAFT_21289 [Ampelomyces quisqualis]